MTIARSVASGVARGVASAVTRGQGAGTAFSPTDIAGLVVWLDAADTSTVLNSIGPDTPATNGQTIRRWNDKSGNANHANQATGANQPLLNSTGINSKPAIVFDGTNDFFALTDSLAPTTAFSCFAVVNVTTTTANKVILARAFNWGSFQMAVVASNGATGPRKLRVGAGVSGVSEGLAFSTGNADAGNAILCGFYDKTNVSASINNESINNTAYTPTITYNAADAFSVGAFRSTSNVLAANLNGLISELLYYNVTLSPTEKAQVMAYLNAKWAVY